MRTQKHNYQEDILESLTRVGKYNEWIVSKFEGYLGKNVLELGAGLGNITLKVRDRGFDIVPTDIDHNFLKSLRKINSSAFYLDIEQPGLDRGSKFDTIVAINVIEHIKNDNKAFKNVYNLLDKEGIFVILVPAHKFLYGSYDALAKHYRRYSKRDLTRKLVKTGFFIERIKYYNKLSALGWFLNARVLQKKEFPKFQLFAVNLLVPLLDFLDKIIPFDFGLSIICIAKKRTVKSRNGA